MLDNLLVSVIVPVYNQEMYLRKSIPSILNQTYKNLDIVLVNDGSTDKSLKILNEFLKIDNRITIVDKENGGLVSASVAGVRHSKGKYICFLDPDDFYGCNFIENFMNALDDDYDFIAAGFYRDSKGVWEPAFLKEDAVYYENIDDLRRTFLLEKNMVGVSDQIFISRWNKCYKAATVNKIIDQFDIYRDISLGEDTVFTYLLLKNAKKVKTISCPNEYYYNVGNQSSMMKNGDIQTHLKKSNKAFIELKKILDENKEDNSSAYALYYFLIDSLINRIVNDGCKNWNEFCRIIKTDKIYNKATKIIRKNCPTLKNTAITLLKGERYPELFFLIEHFVSRAKPVVKWCYIEPKAYIRDIAKQGIRKANQLYCFRKKRRDAFKDLNEQLPTLERRIYPYIQDSINQVTVLERCPIESNIFVFWWDGFEQAPLIVKRCLESIKRNHKGFRVYEVSKWNFMEYTDINAEVINGFKKGMISIQTFSDILRFNLLKNNGGIWIDATIYFAEQFNLIEGLKEKSFESVVFSSSEYFVNYNGLKCSWSGYYIASRKNGLLVSVIDEIFRQYYLEYKTYSIYFFIDAVFMICKKYGIDDNVLDKVKKNENSMFILEKVFQHSYSDELMKQIKKIPQKLSWFEKVDENSEGTMYDVLIDKGVIE